ERARRYRRSRCPRRNSDRRRRPPGRTGTEPTSNGGAEAHATDARSTRRPCAAAHVMGDSGSKSVHPIPPRIQANALVSEAVASVFLRCIFTAARATSSLLLPAGGALD